VLGCRGLKPPVNGSAAKPPVCRPCGALFKEYNEVARIVFRFPRREAAHVCLSCGAVATHVYRGRCGGVLFPRRVGSGIKIIGVADNFYVAREGYDKQRPTGAHRSP
jgi:hypothetical protein